MYEVKRNILHHWKIVNGVAVITVDQRGKLLSMSRPTGVDQQLNWKEVESVIHVVRQAHAAEHGKMPRFAKWSDEKRRFLERCAVDLNGLVEEKS